MGDHVRMVHAHKMHPDASSQGVLNFDAAVEDGVAQVVGVVSVELFREVFRYVDTFELLGACVFVCVYVCVCAYLRVCGGGGGGCLCKCVHV